MRCSFLFWGFLLFISVTASASAADAPRPNILMFYVDDMGWGSIGPNGQAARKRANLPSVKTPNLDRLAADGVNFTRGYGCHVCSPARSSLQTGFHQGHTFADRNDPNNARKAIRSDDISIGTSLANAGYATGYWGKWGYGGSKDHDRPVIDNIQTLPTSHGFQHVLAELHHVRAHTFFQPTLWKAPAPNNTVGGLYLTANSLEKFQGSEKYPDFPASQNHAEYPKTAYCDDSYAFAALDFVRHQGQQYNQAGQPFIGILAVQIPHAPFEEISTLPDWDSAYSDDPHFKNLKKQSQQWAAMVTRIDAHFGNILAALEDPNADGDDSDSVADNTLVIFQSDNGGPSGSSKIEFDANGELSGIKGKIQEGGIRVPLVMRWPAKIHQNSRLKSGSQTDMVVDCTDLLPTFCELAGAKLPVGIDGVSIAPTLSGTKQQRERPFIIHEASNGQSIIAKGYKLVRSRSKALQLYNLNDDPAEATNIAKSRPQITKRLQGLLLDEQVLQPKGFANSYHRWLGADQGDTSIADHWSKYEYSNAGITYIQEAGAPKPSWIAQIVNEGDEINTAIVDADLSVLGLNIQGNSQPQAEQVVAVPKDVLLTGRNEIRISDLGTLKLNGGQLKTLRWIEIHEGGSLVGYGTIDGTVYQSGDLSVDASKAVLKINGALRQTSSSTLRFDNLEVGSTQIHVNGNASIAGKLSCMFSETSSAKADPEITLLQADRIDGRFANSDETFVTRGGSHYRIEYRETEVVLVRK